MTKTAHLTGSFDTLDQAADALDALREVGIQDEDITVVSSLPHSHKALGRPAIHSWLPAISVGSAMLGLVLGVALTVGTPFLYQIRVGGQDIVPTPTTLVLVFEFTMLFLILGTFIGSVLLNSLPTRGPQPVGPTPSSDDIGIFLRCEPGLLEDARGALLDAGALGIKEPTGDDS